MKRPGDPPVTALIQPSGHQTPRPGRHDPCTPRAGTGLMGRGTSNVLSYRYATGPIRAVPDPPRPMSLLSRAVGALTASGPLRDPIPLRMWPATNGPGRRNTGVCAGHHLGGAPRRNRTGDPILTMDRRPSAVLTALLAGRAAPSVAKLWAQCRTIKTHSDRRQLRSCRLHSGCTRPTIVRRIVFGALAVAEGTGLRGHAILPGD
jgi:hypothetical protein